MTTEAPGARSRQVPDNAPSLAGSNGEERDSRRIGIVLIVAGCLLMGLAAGEVSSGAPSADAQDTPAQARSGLAP